MPETSQNSNPNSGYSALDDATFFLDAANEIQVENPYSYKPSIAEGEQSETKEVEIQFQENGSDKELREKIQPTLGLLGSLMVGFTAWQFVKMFRSLTIDAESGKVMRRVIYFILNLSATIILFRYFKIIP